MENRWILHVEGLGKIESADVEVAPLTLFVGDNNSGKSYLMTILYTLLNARFYNQGYDLCQESEEFLRCADWVHEQFQRCLETEKKTLQVVLTSDIRGHFNALLNLVLEKNLQKLVRYGFNSEVPIKHLAITLPDAENQAVEFKMESEGDDGAGDQYTLRPVTNGKYYTKARARTDSGRFFVGFLLEYLIKSEFKTFAMEKAVFLPTSRTGFLLTYRSLVQASLADQYDTEEQKQVSQQLTRPCSDFLKNLAAISGEEEQKRYHSVLRFIEKKMVHGEISLAGDVPQAAVSYRPENADVNIPMHLTSGVVTELTPLVLMLKYYEHLQVLFMEEPEIGLHPELQQGVAKVFVQMYAKRTPLFITTHSDIILQHFNNMIKLGNLPEAARAEAMEQFGYGEHDILRAEDVAVYQFTSDPSGWSQVERLCCTQYGFVVPTFNDALSSLLDETRRLEPDEEEDENEGRDGDV